MTPKQGYRAGGDRAWLWAAMLIVLAACVLALLWFPVIRLDALPALNYNEGWNAYRDRMAADGRPLYGAPPHLWITNYPPLAFHIVGWLGSVFGTMVLAGRVLSLAALLTIGLLIAGIVRVATGAWRAGAYAGLCALIWIATWTPGLVAIDDPEFLGAAISLSGLLAYMFGPRRTGWLAVSALAFALGAFIKQDCLALPLGVLCHLGIVRNWRGAALWLASGALAGTVLLGLTLDWDGPYLFAHLLRPRAYDTGQGVQAVAYYLGQFAAPLTLGVVVLIVRRAIAFRQLLLIALGLALVAAAVLAGGDGVALNIFDLPIMLGAIVAAVAAHRVIGRGQAPLAALVLLIPAWPGLVAVPRTLRADIAASHRLPAETMAARQTIALLRGHPGPAFCQTILLCYDAGKPLAADPFFVKDQIATGRLGVSAITQRLAARHYAIIQIDSATFDPHRHPRSRFYLGFMQQLQADYRPLQIGPIDSLFVPRRGQRPH